MAPLDAPPGHRIVPTRTTYLEMLRNEVPERPGVPAGFRIERWAQPDRDEYRALFSAVGGDWGWTGRLLPSDAELDEILSDANLEIYRLVAEPEGEVAGFAELERRTGGDVEIVYFGLTAGFIGRGLGGVLLRWAIHEAWTAGGSRAEPARRVWLHTCDFDSETALGFYRHLGFQVYDEKVEMEPYPEDFLSKLGR
jgi:GNAT superfamily N-acetyltransferase